MNEIVNRFLLAGDTFMPDILNDVKKMWNMIFFLAEYNEESHEKDPKFKADDHVRI